MAVTSDWPGVIRRLGWRSLPTQSDGYAKPFAGLVRWLVALSVVTSGELQADAQLAKFTCTQPIRKDDAGNQPAMPAQSDAQHDAVWANDGRLRDLCENVRSVSSDNRHTALIKRNFTP